MVNNIKKQRKASKRSTRGAKISFSEKGEKRLRTDIKIFLNKNLSEEEKQKKVGYVKNYYLAYKKYFLGSYKVVWTSKNILTYKK